MSGFNLYRHMQEHGRNIESIRALEGRMKALEAKHAADVKALTVSTAAATATLDQAKGGWRTLLLVGSIAGTLGAIITRVFFH